MTSLRPDARAGHVAALLLQRLGPGIVEDLGETDGEAWLGTTRERLLVLLQLLRDDADLEMRLLLDVTATDRGTSDAPEAAARFAVLYRLRSPRLGYRATVSVPVDDADAAVPSTTGLFPAAAWYERELWEMFGVYPDGHPHLRPLLMYEQFSGHPLRKDYPGTKSQPLVPLRSQLSEPAVVGEGDA